MGLVSVTNAFIIMILIVIISGIVSWMDLDYKHFDKGKFHTFITVLSGLGVFVTFMFYYNIVQLQHSDQELTAAQEVDRINLSILDTSQKMYDFSTIIPYFISTLNPLTTCYKVKKDEENSSCCTAKNCLSNRIFTVWQDLVLSDRFIKTEKSSYISNFLQRANSKQLYDIWQKTKIDYDLSTQIFGDLLFSYGLKIENQTIEEYDKISKILIKDPKYIKLFN